MIGPVLYLRHNITNKNFDRLVLLYKIISQNSKILYQTAESYQQTLPDYEDLIKGHYTIHLIEFNFLKSTSCVM